PATFSRIATTGPKWMLHPAPSHISVDFEDHPLELWRLLNCLAPFVTAMFANSPVYGGEDTGHRSFRAHCWRMLDPQRTGLPYEQHRPVEAYLDFALGAPAILLPTVGGRCASFDYWLSRANPSLDEWETHLTTLFPEVRPRGHLEVRSIDALDPAWYPAALAMVAGLAYQADTRRDALDLLPAPDLGLLERAGRLG